MSSISHILPCAPALILTTLLSRAPMRPQVHVLPLRLAVLQQALLRGAHGDALPQVHILRRAAASAGARTQPPVKARLTPLFCQAALKHWAAAQLALFTEPSCCLMMCLLLFL